MGFRRAILVSVFATGGGWITPIAAQQTSSRQFTLLPGERTSLVFGASAAGTVTVQVQSQGQPLLVAVISPDGKEVAQQQGAGQIALSVPVTAAERKASALWTVSVRGARDVGTPMASMRSAPRALASGTITVAGPLLTDKDVDNLLAPRLAAARQASAVVPARPANVATPDLSAARLALTQRTASVQKAQLQAIAPSLPATAVAQVQQRIEIRAKGDVPPTLAVTDRRMTIGVAQRVPSTGMAQQAASGVTPVGTATGAAATAAPAIARLSVAQGEPGTPVLIDGNAFGDAQGEVRFVVASGADLPAPVMVWSNAQVLVEVPRKDSVQAYNGYVYLKRADGTKSALLPFGFQPTMDVATYCVPKESRDISITAPGEPSGYFAPLVVFHFTLAFGFAGYDEFNLQGRLRNGWRTERIEIRDFYCEQPGALTKPNRGGAYLVDWRPGSDSPYAKVRWWMDGGTMFETGNSVQYSVAVTVTGPKGLPFR